MRSVMLSPAVVQTARIIRKKATASETLFGTVRAEPRDQGGGVIGMDREWQSLSECDLTTVIAVPVKPAGHHPGSDFATTAPSGAPSRRMAP